MHQFTRRCKNHDYRSRRIYLITLLKSAGAPCFSSITADPGASGRLLIVTTEQYPVPPRKVDDLHAQELNAIAATLAQLPPRAGRLIPRR